jgi:catalase
MCRALLLFIFAISLVPIGATSAQMSAPPAVQASTPEELVDALNGVFGSHPGARAVHAKGIVLEGSFKPSSTASAVSKAPHLQQTEVPVTVRFSNFAGIPDIPDNQGLASPRGLAIKFKLPDGSDSDIVAHSFNGFPSATADDFRDLLKALGSSGAQATKPTPLDKYLASHSVAKAFLTAPKPMPASYGTLPYYGVNTFKFTNKEGLVTFGRYQFIPMAGSHFLSDDEASKKGNDYLNAEIRARVEHGPVDFKLVIQVAAPGDKLEDPSIAWSDTRQIVELGTISVREVVQNNDAAQQALLFLPNALPSGIEPQDPMIDARSAAYPVSFGRRHR